MQVLLMSLWEIKTSHVFEPFTNEGVPARQERSAERSLQLFDLRDDLLTDRNRGLEQLRADFVADE